MTATAAPGRREKRRLQKMGRAALSLVRLYPSFTMEPLPSLGRRELRCEVDCLRAPRTRTQGVDRLIDVCFRLRCPDLPPSLPYPLPPPPRMPECVCAGGRAGGLLLSTWHSSPYPSLPYLLPLSPDPYVHEN